ncbi:D-alanyl-D-alanine carboxypeptidase [Streptomyces sp. 1114.5]|uniref:serine hydrolase domain-containing protein n=1 Tax=unclassified Streptomyces TaxID=2593676 RepID=UPI000BC4A40D|nr:MULTISPECIES: serine hydrolase domain-containing protein [unclassified Streptomyces]RKT19563.1 D-alanyl-D-alanine carboxypeptidase [Streptomyces sp. 1114.5]SOB85758.1 D-alanyl-D-alanine carboxypeptidase [Streptomyces sp. 1331.2]
MTHTRRPRPAAPRSARLAAGAALALTGLLAATACSGDSTTRQAADPAVTAEPAALSPSASPGTSGSASSNAVVPLTSAVTAKLDAAIQRVLSQNGVPGISVGIITPSGTYQKAFGVADKTTKAPMDVGMYTRIGSESKTFTATAVLRLVDQGKVGLDDPISKYVDGVPGGDGITVRELGEMRSGLFPYSSDPDFVSTLINDPNHVFTPDQLLAYGYKHPAVSPPGTEYQYNNSNYILLGKLIEKVGGQSAGDFLKAQVFTPASLGKTSFPTDSALPDPHPRGYTNQTPDGSVQDATNWNPSWAWTAGAVITTLADLESWAKTMATGAIISPATQAERMKLLPTPDPGVTYGFGVFNNAGWIGHNGSMPGYESVAVYMPEAQATMVLLLNTDVISQGQEPSTLFANEITKIISPNNVYALPAETAPPSASGSPSAPASGSPSGLPSATVSGSGTPSLPTGNSSSTVRA